MKTILNYIRVIAFAPSQGALESAYLAATEDRR